MHCEGSPSENGESERRGASAFSRTWNPSGHATPYPPSPQTLGSRESSSWPPRQGRRRTGRALRAPSSASRRTAPASCRRLSTAKRTTVHPARTTRPRPGARATSPTGTPAPHSCDAFSRGSRAPPRCSCAAASSAPAGRRGGPARRVRAPLIRAVFVDRFYAVFDRPLFACLSSNSAGLIQPSAE